VASARNAVAIAREETSLDRAIYRHALSGALIATGDLDEAEALLRDVIKSLEDPSFASLRRQIARSESFEIYSTAGGDVAAYLSLRNRSQLRLGDLLEKRGAKSEALAVYREVLAQRSDDPAALAAVARLSTPQEQARWFALAFDANPFSMPLVRAYRNYLRAGSRSAERATPGGVMQHALEQWHDGKTVGARQSFEALRRNYPANTTLDHLIDELQTSAEVPAFVDAAASPVTPDREELRQLMAAFASHGLAAEQRAALDQLTFRGTAVFTGVAREREGQTILESGTIEGVPFRFSMPTAFHGSFEAKTPLLLTYRFLGVTAIDGAEAILAEPIGIEVRQ
jgi:hypothetical protein